MVNGSNMAWYSRFASVNGFSRGSGEGLLAVVLFFSLVLPLRRRKEKALRREESLEGESGAEFAVDVEGVGLEAERMEGAVEAEDSEEGREPPRARLNLSRIAMVGGGKLVKDEVGGTVWKGSWRSKISDRDIRRFDVG